MISNRKFFKLSEEARMINKFFISSERFKEINVNGDCELEKDSTIYHYVFDNVPYAFRQFPILYENIKRLMALKLNVHFDSIRLIGSAKTGFAIDPDHYGKEFSKNSDLDFAVADPSLFEEMRQEARQWMSDYRLGDIKPKESEKKYWNANFKLLPKNIDRGFIDENKIPRGQRYPHTNDIGNTMFLIKSNLKSFGYMEIKNCSVRVYKDIECFYQQTFLNIYSSIEKISV